MFRRSTLVLGLLTMALVGASCEEEVTERIPLAIRAPVRVYLLPDSDTMTIRLQKRDLNIYDTKPLPAFSR